MSAGSAGTLADLASTLGAESGTVSSEPAAAFMGVTALAFSEAATDTTGWWARPPEHSHTARLSDRDGNPVLYLYADRSTRVHLDQVSLAVAPGATVSTTEAGIALRMGWNRIVLHAGPGSTYTAVQAAGPSTAEFVPAAY